MLMARIVRALGREGAKQARSLFFATLCRRARTFRPILSHMNTIIARHAASNRYNAPRSTTKTRGAGSLLLHATRRYYALPIVKGHERGVLEAQMIWASFARARPACYLKAE